MAPKSTRAEDWCIAPWRHRRRSQGSSRKGLVQVDEKRIKTAVLIDLTRHAQLWDDDDDFAWTRGREKELRESLGSVQKRLQERAKPKTGR